MTKNSSVTYLMRIQSWIKGPVFKDVIRMWVMSGLSPGPTHSMNYGHESISVRLWNLWWWWIALSNAELWLIISIFESVLTPKLLLMVLSHFAGVHLLVVAVDGVVPPELGGGPQHGAVHALGPRHPQPGPQQGQHSHRCHSHHHRSRLSSPVWIWNQLTLCPS